MTLLCCRTVDKKRASSTWGKLTSYSWALQREGMVRICFPDKWWCLACLRRWSSRAGLSWFLQPFYLRVVLQCLTMGMDLLIRLHRLGHERCWAGTITWKKHCICLDLKKKTSANSQKEVDTYKKESQSYDNLTFCARFENASMYCSASFRLAA